MQGLSEEALVLRAVKSGAWKSLFFLVRELSLKKSLEFNLDSLKDLAHASGWTHEYLHIEPHVRALLSGGPVEPNAAVEKALLETSKTVESILLIATDESCPLHIPLVRGPADRRVRQMLGQDENEERVKVLVGTPPSGILLMDSYLETDLWLNSCQEAAVADILRVHEYSYVKTIMDYCGKAAEINNSEGKYWE